MVDYLCAKDPNTKKYIIPTDSWLTPIKKFETTDLNEESLIMISMLHKKNKILVKVTEGINDKLIVFNNLLKNEQNFIQTYCSIICSENKNNVKSEYKNKLGYCETNSNQNENHMVTLEIMKKYNEGSLENMVGTVSFNYYLKILRQLLLIQIYIFDKYGILHNDLHLANILIKTYDDYINLNYIIKTNRMTNKDFNIVLRTKIRLIIIDYSTCISYDPEIYSKYDPNFMNLKIKKTYDSDNKLFIKIIKTFEETIRLLKYEVGQQLLNKINNYINSNDFILNRNLSCKSLRNYYLGRSTYREYIYKEVNLSIDIAKILFKIVSDGQDIITKEFEFDFDF